VLFLDGRIILIIILIKSDVRMYTELNFLRIVSNCEILRIKKWVS